MVRFHPRHVLSQLGYDQFFEEQLRRSSSDLIPGRVVGQHRRQWDVATEQGVVRAVLAGRLWAQDHVVQLDDAQPAVGDWVGLHRDNPESAPVITHLLERRTELSRVSMARRGARQTLVANVDHVAVVAAFAPPETVESVAKRSLHPKRLERYLAAIVAGGAEPTVLINKSDLAPDASKRAAELSLRLSGACVLPVSTHIPGGLNSFIKRLAPGQTIALVGLSGVGKSSIINRLLKRDAQKISGERAHDGRGRHTTTHRELFVTDDGFCLIDTPGMREFALSEVSTEDLAAFSDVIELARGCQFRDCTHFHEPGCAVSVAVTAGSLHPERLSSYQELLAELGRLKEQPARRKIVSHDRRRSPKRGRKDWDTD